MVFKSWIAKKISKKSLKFYDKHIASRFTGAQQVMGLGGMMGLYFLPSIYTYTMETSKTFAPSNIKGYFYDRNYLERVAKLKQHVREQRKKGNRMLSYDDKLMIYSEFLEMIQPKMNEFYEERDLGLKNSIQNMTPDEFISEFKKFDYRE